MFSELSEYSGGVQVNSLGLSKRVKRTEKAGVRGVCKKVRHGSGDPGRHFKFDFLRFKLKYMKYLLAVLFSFLVTLLAACFVQGNFNVMDWDRGTRGFIILLTIPVSLSACAIIEYNKP